MVPKEESTSFIGWIEGAKFTDIDPTQYAVTKSPIKETSC